MPFSYTTPLFLLPFLFLHSTVSASAVITTINNTAPRLDNTGTIMDAHDCSIRVLPNGTYVMHTIEYGLCVAPTGQGCDQTPDHCGFRNTHNVTVYTTNDFSSGSWNYVGYAFDLTARPAGLIFRPDAIFNPNTNLWVMLYNQASPGNLYMSCVSSSPFGPFENFTATNVTDAAVTGGDFHLFNDPENPSQGYIIWTAMQNAPGLDHKIRINKLTPDWLSITSDPAFVFNDNAPSTTFNEAPSIIKRNGIWYALFGHCCCFCENGSGLFVHTALDPMGPWTAATSPYDISCEPPPPPPAANPFCADKLEMNNVTVDLVCEGGGVIDSITHAYFGTPTGSCPNYAAGACDDPTFLAYAVATCVGQTNCTLMSQGSDPCLGTEKSIAAVAHCSTGPGGYSPDGPVPPPSVSRVTTSTSSSSSFFDISVGGEPTPGQGCLYGGSNEVSVTRSQQDFLATIPDGNGGETFLYIGSRWGQSPDGLKGHEPQYMFPLSFEADGNISHITWNDTITFSINDPTK